MTYSLLIALLFDERDLIMSFFSAIIKTLTVTLLFFSPIIFALPEETTSIRNSCFTQKQLSLGEAIALALRNNPQIRSAALQRVVDKFVLEVARNQFLPQYSFNTSATYSNGTKPFYTSNPQTTLETIYGTKISLGLQDQVNAGRETAAVLEVVQPLLRGAGPVTQVGYKTTMQQEVINRLSFKDAVITTITNVVQAYYKLVQDYNTVSIDEIALIEANSLLRATQLRIQAGKLAPTELVQQQIRIVNLKMGLTRDRNSLAQDYRAFLILLGLDPRSQLIINKSINIFSHSPLPTPDEAICIALNNNIEYQKSLAKLKQLELALIAAKNAQRWKLDLIGRAQQELIRNEAFAPVNINQIDAIGNNPIGSNQTVVINLNIPIHDVNRRQEVVRAKIALQQFRLALETQKQQLIANVLNNLENLTSQLTQIKLADEAVYYSKQSVDIANKKFLYGRATMFEVISLQQNLTLQQIGLITEKISYLNNEAIFVKLLGNSLDKWCIHVNY